MNREDNQYQEKLLKISRVSKTTKGGRTISFSVLAAVGDGEGKIGLGLGKANGVPDAIRKAVAAAKKNIVKVSLKIIQYLMKLLVNGEQLLYGWHQHMKGLE